MIRTTCVWPCVVLCLLTSRVHGQPPEIAGKVFAVSNGFTADSSHPQGSHFHSTDRNDLPPGNPTILLENAAEVGGFFGDEEVRGMAEFDLSSQSPVPHARLKFDVLDVSSVSLDPIGGLFGQTAYQGSIDLFAYRGNNIDDLTDYEMPATSIDPFDVLDASTLSLDMTVQRDITGLFNQLVSESATQALGVRLQMSAPADPGAGAITFHNFRIEVPEPHGWTLILFGFAWFSFKRKHQCRSPDYVN